MQKGKILGLPQSKPIRQIHKNAFELRVKDKKGIYRIIYVMCLERIILIPHAFTKKTQRTALKEIKTSVIRLKELLSENK